MTDYLIALALSTLPAIGSILGGWWAEYLALSNCNLSLALHAAAGIALAVVGVELMPQILQANPPWLVILAFVAGGGFFVVIRWLIKWVQNRVNKVKKKATAWLIFLGVGVDLFSDGLTFNLFRLTILGDYYVSRN